jgi:hypothetical protein
MEDASLFSFDNENLELVHDFFIMKTGKFAKLKKRLIDHVLSDKKARKLLISVDLQIHLYNTMIVLIICHGSEVWGIENLKCIDQFQL